MSQAHLKLLLINRKVAHGDAARVSRCVCLNTNISQTDPSLSNQLIRFFFFAGFLSCVCSYSRYSRRMEGWRVGYGDEGGPLQKPQNREGQEVKWNPRTEKKREPRSTHWTFFFPAHHTCLQEETVMSPTSHLQTMVAGRKQQVMRGGGRRAEEGGESC